MSDDIEFDADPDPDEDDVCEVVGCGDLAPVTLYSDDLDAVFEYCNAHAREKYDDHSDLDVVKSATRGLDADEDDEDLPAAYLHGK